jgi:hypothetical protein
MIPIGVMLYVESVYVWKMCSYHYQIPQRLDSARGDRPADDSRALIGVTAGCGRGCAPPPSRVVASRRNGRRLTKQLSGGLFQRPLPAGASDHWRAVADRGYRLASIASIKGFVATLGATWQPPDFLFFTLDSSCLSGRSSTHQADQRWPGGGLNVTGVLPVVYVTEFY